MFENRDFLLIRHCVTQFNRSFTSKICQYFRKEFTPVMRNAVEDLCEILTDA